MNLNKYKQLLEDEINRLDHSLAEEIDTDEHQLLLAEKFGLEKAQELLEECE